MYTIRKKQHPYGFQGNEESLKYTLMDKEAANFGENFFSWQVITTSYEALLMKYRSVCGVVSALWKHSSILAKPFVELL